jgi:hypothetical protein
MPRIKVRYLKGSKSMYSGGYPEDGDSTPLRKADKYLPDYTHGIKAFEVLTPVVMKNPVF